MAKKFNVTGEQDLSIDKQMSEIKRQLRQKGGSPLDPELVILALQDIVEGKFNYEKETPKTEVVKSIFRNISEGHVLTLKALSGNRLICNSADTFKSGIDGDFVNWGVNNPGIATPEISVKVDEMIGDGKFMDIFRALPGNWNQKWLSQDQVIEFCETLPDWLRQGGYGTFFLIKKDENLPIDEEKPEDNLVVVLVLVRGDGLRAEVRSLEFGLVWFAGFRLRVVSPQLPIHLAK